MDRPQGRGFGARGVLVAMVLSCVACAPQPALVGQGNAAASFGGSAASSGGLAAPGAPGGADDEQVVGAARACVARLDEHRNAAGQGGTVRLALTIVGSAIGGGGGAAGGILSALGADQTARTAGNVLAISGAVVGAVGTSLGAGVADPAARLALRARALRYYNTAQLLMDQLRRESDPARRTSLRTEVLWNLQVCRADGDMARLPRPAALAPRVELMQ